MESVDPLKRLRLEWRFFNFCSPNSLDLKDKPMLNHRQRRKRTKDRRHRYAHYFRPSWRTRGRRGNLRGPNLHDEDSALPQSHPKTSLYRFSRVVMSRRLLMSGPRHSVNARREAHGLGLVANLSEGWFSCVKESGVWYLVDNWDSHIRYGSLPLRI